MRRWAERPSLKFYSLKLAGCRRCAVTASSNNNSVRSASASGRSTSTTIHLYMCTRHRRVGTILPVPLPCPYPAHSPRPYIIPMHSRSSPVTHRSESHPHLYHTHPKKRPACRARQTAELAGAASAFVRTLICSLRTALCADKRPTFATSAAWSSCFFVKLFSEGCPDDSESCCPVLR